MIHSWNNDPPPDDAIRRDGLSFVKYDLGQTGRTALCCKAWRGKCRKPYANHRFRNTEHRDEWIDRECESARATIDHRAEHERSRKTDTAAMCKQIQVGTILRYSWGYDQTNVDYFEVVEKSPSGKTVMVRPIGLETVASESAERCGPMSDMVRPVTGTYYGPPVRKLITPNGVSFDHGGGYPCDPNSSTYRSWYH